MLQEISKQIWKEHVPTWERRTLFKIREIIDAELRKRSLDRTARNDYLESGWYAFANFMHGVAQAMACRAVLRWSKGHEPYGKREMHGACWSQLEIHQATKMVEETINKVNSFAYTPWLCLYFNERFENLWFGTEEITTRWKWFNNNDFIF